MPNQDAVVSPTAESGPADVGPPHPPSKKTARPKSTTDLFLSFTVLALQGFGGVIAVAQRELVDKKRWLTTDEFIDDWSVAHTLPGPNVVNLSLMIGERYFGLRGALAALAGLLMAPLVLVIALAVLAAGIGNNPAMAGALRGMGAVAAALIASTGLKMMPSLRNNILGIPACLAFGTLTFLAMGILRLPLGTTMLALGTGATAFAYRRLTNDRGAEK